jgi:hypothetical protein
LARVRGLLDGPVASANAATARRFELATSRLGASVRQHPEPALMNFQLLLSQLIRSVNAALADLTSHSRPFVTATHPDGRLPKARPVWRAKAAGPQGKSFLPPAHPHQISLPLLLSTRSPATYFRNSPLNPPCPRHEFDFGHRIPGRFINEFNRSFLFTSSRVSSTNERPISLRSKIPDCLGRQPRPRRRASSSTQARPLPSTISWTSSGKLPCFSVFLFFSPCRQTILLGMGRDFYD